jgi:hypothetical protein
MRTRGLLVAAVLVAAATVAGSFATIPPGGILFGARVTNPRDG